MLSLKHIIDELLIQVSNVLQIPESDLERNKNVVVSKICMNHNGSNAGLLGDSINYTPLWRSDQTKPMIETATKPSQWWKQPNQTNDGIRRRICCLLSLCCHSSHWTSLWSSHLLSLSSFLQVSQQMFKWLLIYTCLRQRVSWSVLWIYNMCWQASAGEKTSTSLQTGFQLPGWSQRPTSLPGMSLCKVPQERQV